jgi:hypothetical protein
MRVRRRIGRLPVRSQVGLDFDNAPGNELPLWGPSDKYLAKEKPRHALRRRLKKGAAQQLAWQLDSPASLQEIRSVARLNPPVLSLHDLVIIHGRCGRGRPHDSRSPTPASKDRSPGTPVWRPALRFAFQQK